jgi:oligopeptide/dipeptide ABC transporter ATP-binding protein
VTDFVKSSAPAAAPDDQQALLQIEHLSVMFPVRSGTFGAVIGHVHAVDDVTITLAEGETLGLVGESGCGKTTLARTLVRLTDATSGTIRFRGEDLTKKRNKDLKAFRRNVQMVFQDPQASLNPRKRISAIVGAGARLRGAPKGAEGREQIGELLARVGLDPDHAQRYPHEFSGGQRQRIGIARALAADPRLIILDEPVSALDVSVQAQIVNLLDDLQDSLGLSYIFVAHDLSVVKHVSDRIAVMYLGKIVELSRSEDLYARPMHPYTSSLLDAIPIPDPDRRRDRRGSIGELPSAMSPPGGCRFHTRCPWKTDLCTEVEPPLADFGGHLVACHHPLNVTDAEMGAATRSENSPTAAGPELTLSPSQAHDVEIDQSAGLDESTGIHGGGAAGSDLMHDS